ncbi:MAG: hypothetical protein ACK5IC_02460 [Moheibacter sp.]
MKQKLIIFLILILSISCKKNTIISSDSSIPVLDATPKKSYTTCEELLSDIIKSSNAIAVQSFSNIQIRIENVSAEKIKIELFVQNDISEDPSVKRITDQTVGWLVFFPSTQKLLDITNDTENPKILEFDMKILSNVDIENLCEPSKAIISSDQEKNTDFKRFKELFNKNMIGLSIINKKEQNIFKKYVIDFSSSCMCNSPSIFIDQDKNEIILFNYCDGIKKTEEIKKKHILKISRIDVENEKLIISTKNLLKFNFTKKNRQLFQLQVEGKLPSDYIGAELKSFFTTQPEKFQKEDCGDFDG